MSPLDQLGQNMEILNRLYGDIVLIISALCLAALGLIHVQTSDAVTSSQTLGVQGPVL